MQVCSKTIDVSLVRQNDAQRWCSQREGHINSYQHLHTRTPFLHRLIPPVILIPSSYTDLLHRLGLDQMLVSRSSPLSHPLSKHNKEDGEHGNSKAQATYAHKSVLQAHALDPGLNAEGDTETDDVSDENDGSHDLRINLLVGIENITHSHCTTDTKAEANETHADDGGDPRKTVSGSGTVYDQASWHDECSWDESPKTIFWFSPTSVTVAEVYCETIVQRTREVGTDQGADEW